MNKLKQKYAEKEIKIIKFEFNGKIIYSALFIRKGLKEFFEFTKKFCNYYINTLGYENYGLKIQEVLENKLGIKFIKLKARKNQNDKVKFLSDLLLDTKNTVIFDDKSFVWIKDKLNVITSKVFIDKEINLDNLERLNLGNNTYLFLKNFSPFFYYESSEENWQIQKLNHEEFCPFYDLKEKDCFSGEYLEPEEYQFIYMKEIIKIIYYLVNQSNISIPEALKLIRYDIFYNSYFNLNYYEKKGKEILKEIIKICGGIIFDKNNKKELNNNKSFFVCSFDDYYKYQEEIEKEKLVLENFRVISDKYIINSFYFMTNLENELDNPQYCLDIKDNENFDDY